MLKNYSCGICKTLPDQISHHKSHLETQKHKDKKELLELKLLKIDKKDLEEKYGTTNIEDIINETETILYKTKLKSILQEYEEQKMSDMQQQVKNTMEKEMTSVSNKEALKDKIHEIHNYLRNHGAGYGMNALKVFNILYGLKKIEENGLLDKVKLQRPQCDFSYLLKLANEDKYEELAELIFGVVLDSIGESEIRELLFYEIPRNIRGSVFSYLIKEINKITLIEKTCNVLLSGKIYEYFIGRDESAISELGAYFTDRHIVEYIMNKLNLTINEDGIIPSMVDMFGGSGGFTTGYINYIKENYPQVNWETEINKISHYDMNEDVIKSAGLEFFCLTGQLPNMNQLKYKNSFQDDFNDIKYQLILTNPPYGGDKNKETTTQEKRKKVKEYIKNELTTIQDEGLRIQRQKQLKKIEAEEKQEKKEQEKQKVCLTSCSTRIQKFAKDNNLTGNDKESCSLMLLMDMLEVGGTCIGVLKEGVFFNKTYKNLRKCLVENYNVREVISVPADQFENTSTKTSIVIFDNSVEKTSEVIFRELIVEKYEKDTFCEVYGDILLIENEGDIKGISDAIISSASREEIVGNNICSLNGKDYNKKEIVVGDEFELVKLGDVCEIVNKKNKLHNKLYNYVEISDIENNTLSNFTTYETDKLPNKASNKADYGNILISCVRPKSSKILFIHNYIKNIDNFIFSSGLANIKLKNINNAIYIYAMLYILSNNFEKDLCNGSSYPRFTPKILENLQIPIPKSQQKIKEWVDRISQPYNEKNTKQQQIKDLELFVQERIKEIGEKEDCEEVELGNVCEYIKTGKNKTPDNKKGTLYPYYGTADITGYTNHYLFDGKYILVARNGTMGNCFLVEGKIYPSDHIFVIKNNEKINILTLYYLIKSISIKIQNSSNGSTIKGISKENLSKIKIKIPKNKQIIQDLEQTFQQIENLQQEVKHAEELYKQVIQELSEEAIPTTKSILKEEVEKVKETLPEITIVKVKKTKKAKKEKTLQEES